jgi:hypothetical protein
MLRGEGRGPAALLPYWAPAFAGELLQGRTTC